MKVKIPLDSILSKYLSSLIKNFFVVSFLILESFCFNVSNLRYYKKNFQINSTNFPVAERFYSEEVSLPIYYKLKDAEVIKVISEIKKIIF